MRDRDQISRMLGTNERQKSFHEKNPYLDSGGKASDLGIDLSERAIDSLNRDLKAAGLHGPRMKAEEVDFLSPDFDEAGFDVVYAKSVLHHFEHLGTRLEVLRAKLAPDGRGGELAPNADLAAGLGHVHALPDVSGRAGAGVSFHAPHLRRGVRALRCRRPARHHGPLQIGAPRAGRVEVRPPLARTGYGTGYGAGTRAGARHVALHAGHHEAAPPVTIRSGVRV